ncbi:MAG: aminotransferase class I/II-fold pyridoxal phosphate-dependent enzyme [Thermoguttaceae bacterium]
MYETILTCQHIVELLQYRAHTQRDDDAFVYLSGGLEIERAMTNGELDRLARRIGAWIQDHGLVGERVLLLYPPGLDFIAAFFGCLYGGAIAVPVYPPRKNRSILRIQAVCDSARAAVAFTTRDVEERVVTMLDEAPSLREIPWLATDTLEDTFEDNWRHPNISHETLAFLQFTSGSTGTPKGVMLTHGNLLHNSRLIHLGFEHTRSGSGVFWLPSYHDMGLIGGIIQPVFVGGTNYVMSPLTFLQRPIRWLEAISRFRPYTSGGPNFAYDLCVRQVTDEQVATLDLSSWKVAFNGAEPILPETLDAFSKKFAPAGFQRSAFYPCFGLAEATLLVTGGFVADEPIIKVFDADKLAVGEACEVDETHRRARKLVSSGRSIIDQVVRIVDPESRIELADRHVGEVWVSGPSMAHGYWDNPEATAATFHATLADSDDKRNHMRTGDLGFLLDGELFITGRIKDMMIIRGVNIYPQDIETTVLKADTSLRPLGGAAFLAEANDGVERLVVVQEVERRFKGEMSEVLFAEIRRRVALEHEINVDAVVLVKSGSIPKTSSGKIQRHVCRTGFLGGTLNEIVRWTSAGVTFPTVIGGEVVESDLVEATAAPQAPAKIVRHGAMVARTTETTPTPSSPRPTSPAPTPKTVVANAENVDHDTIVTIVLEDVRRVGKERAATLTPSTDLTEIGLDSLERMEILAVLEDRFGGQFPESLLPELTTAELVARAVGQYLGGVARTKQSREVVATTEIGEENYVIAAFPEYRRLRERLDFLAQTGLGHFFDVHEGITGDRTQIAGREMINFSSYNYIGTSGDAEVTRAAQDACARYGTSVSASRLVSGEKPLHQELEREITKFLGTQSTIVLVGGHATNESTIGHLMGEGDLILHDALAHNSIVQGAILSGARRRPFPHNDIEAADWILQQHRGEYRRVLIVAEGVYSMDGDYPDLPRLVDLKKRHKSLLMIDEAHSMGVLGKTGRGIGEHFGVNPSDVDVWMCTFSKTFASCGGYISGSKELVEYLKFTLPGFVFSVGMPPAAAGAALAALRILEREPQRTERLRQNAALFLKLAQNASLDTGMSRDSAVIPVIVGQSIGALQLAEGLFQRGINVQPILHPAVEERAARLRFFITSLHTEEQIRYTVQSIDEEMTRLNLRRK